MALPKVLMVAEKPSIALSIATALSHGQMSTRRGSTEVHEFDGRFLGSHARFKVTSVIGHVFSVDFHGKYQDWATTDPLDLFQAQIIKSESNPKAHICKHLKQEARGCHYLVLWLDCDREGENICFEVIESTGFKINDVYRARFSSVTEKDVLNALANLVRPNRDEAMAVDARQEIDLKVGVAFTRFQTSFFQGKYGNLDARVISYGPCQTPTLGFCVQRYLQINTFKPEKFWSLHPYIIQSGYEILLEWQRSKLFDINVAMMFQKLVAEDGILEVTDISEKQETKGRPVGLNTVNLLKVASSSLGFGPQTAMQLAERLYTQGFISYPRTESTAYPPSFDFRGALSAQRNNPTWGNYVEGLLTSGYQKPRSGTDVGDHPPITPMRSASEDMLGNDAWKLYQYICQYFIGTVSPDCKYVRKKVEFSVGGESFHCTGQHVITKGFTAIMPWLAINDKSIPSFTKGEKIEVSKVELYEGNTTPPDFLTESELISLMEKNGIGTDASIPVRILILTLSNLLATMFSHHHRGLLCKGKRFDCIVVLLCIFFCVSACGICSTNLRPNAPEYGACESSLKSCNSGFSDAVVGGDGLGSVFPPIRNSFQNVCPDTHSFRAPSSLKAATFGGSGNQCNGPFCVGLAQASEVTRNMKGLLLFPHNVIHVGIIYCNNPRNDLRNMSPEVSNLQENCKLVILTNDTTSPQVEIPCEDVPNICFEHQRLSFVGSKDNSKPGDSRSMTAEYAVRNKGLAPNVKVTETADVDALVFGNRVSLLEDVEVVFPMVQVGSYVSKWITVRNPSHLPVTVQLILNKEEIVDECRGPDDMIQNFSAANLVIDEVISAAKYGFSVTESAVTEAYVHPYDYATLGPIIFYPSKRCRWNGSAVIRNNLTGIEMVPLRGIGGLHSLALLERSEHVQSINFDLQMHNLLSFSLLYSLLHMKDMISVCSQPFVKEIYAKNTGDLPLEVKTMRVSGKECGLDGFKIQDCKGFSLDPGESIKLLISYQTDFSAATVQRDLELALASGIFLIPMKASVPFDVLCNCKKFLFWTRVKKLLLGFILFASLFFMVSLDYLCKNDSNSMHITLQHSGKTPIVLPCNQRKDKLSMSGKMTNTICSAGKGATSPIRATCVSYSYDPSETSDQYSENYKQFSLLLNTPKKEKLPTIEVQSSDVTIPPPQSETKTKTGKEKGRRKKKNNKSFGAKLPAVSEVSSSRSGNSTPLSPVAPASKKSSWPLSPNVEQHHKKFQPSASKTNTSKKHRVLVNSVSETVSSPKVSHSPLSSDASTPLKMFCPASPPMSGIPSRSLVSTSSISFSLRAPGSKLDKQKTVLAPKEVGFEEYTYDIWGGHFSGLHLLLPKDVPCMKSSPDEKNFSSFFVGEPQSIK